MNTKLTPIGVALDAWSTQRRGSVCVRQRQRERLAALLDYARARSPFYFEQYRGLPPRIEKVQDLPPVTKARLMARFDDWVTDSAVRRIEVEHWIGDLSHLGQDYLGRYLLCTTSGSSGTPAILVLDHRELAVMNGLGYVRALRNLVSRQILWAILRTGGRSAAVFATGGHFLGAALMTRRQRAMPWRANRYRLFSALSPLSEIVEGLISYQPGLLSAYPSALLLLAQEQAAGRLYIRPAFLGSAGETLTPAGRNEIEAAFACPVVDLYNATEVNGSTFVCRRGAMHYSADWFIFEPVGEHRRPVPIGQPSYSLLVTNLANYIQPVIRYELGDSVTMLPGRCGCGSPFPHFRVEGRTDEILTFPGWDGREIKLLPLALESIIEETPGLQRFQLIQTGPHALALRLDVQPGADRDHVSSAAETKLRNFLQERGIVGAAIEHSSETPRPNARGGKLRHVWREFTPDSQTAFV
jgi:phenylacetate-coenzyme A ligase PaaK-like adenylate-forming protein